jgi:hypothetical protein
MHSTKESVRITHREFVTNIYSNRYDAPRFYGGAPPPAANPVAGVTGTNYTTCTYANSVMSFRVQPGYGIFGASGIPQNPQGKPQFVTAASVAGVPQPVPAEIYPSPAFAAVAVSDNQGQNPIPVSYKQQSLFPWLSRIAQQFEQYRIRGMVLQYIPVTADTSSGNTISTGSVDFYVEYNVSSAPPTGVIAQAVGTEGGKGNPNCQALFLNNMWARSVKPSEPLTVPIECAPNQTPMDLHYVTSARILNQTGAPSLVPGEAPVLSIPGDLRLFDYATVYVVASGQSVDQNQLGQLWVSYDIEFFKPQLNVR